MAQDFWHEIREIFDQAMELPTAQRQAFVREAAKGDEKLAEHVIALLSSEGEASSFLHAPISANFKTLMTNPAHNVPDFSAGDAVAHFVIRRILGSGSFGKVYLAKDTILERDIALKITPLRGEEAKTMAKLEHPNIVSVFSQSMDEKRKLGLLCMQFVPGLTLAEVISRLKSHSTKSLTGADLLRWIDEAAQGSILTSQIIERELIRQTSASELFFLLTLKLAQALAYAHAHDILHLDLKPANILLGVSGMPMLTDFNVSHTQTQLGSGAIDSFGGTFDYMSPEHKNAFVDMKGLKLIDRRSDIYSLGGSLMSLYNCIEPAPNEAVTWERLRAILATCQKEEPAKRFQNAEELTKALEAEMYMHRLSRSLPGKGRLLKLCETYGLTTVLLAVFMPNILGSLFNIAYNSVKIVSDLTLAQQEFFVQLLPPFNITVYVLMGFIAFILFKDVLVFARTKTPQASLTRAKLLKFPFHVAAYLTLCWLIGAIFWPSVLHFFKGGLSLPTIFHFNISFIVSWIISMTYAVIGLQFLVVRVLYPRLLGSCTEISSFVSNELGESKIGTSLFRYLAVSLPLLGAILIVFTTPSQLSASQLQVFRILVASLIGGGLFGLIAALRIGSFIDQTLNALKNGINHPG